MKYVMIIPDGLTDLAVKELKNKTPLEKAYIPHINFLLQNGLTGAVRTVPDHHEPGSDVANLSLLGVDPRKVRIGRGALEALSQNIRINKQETILRLNFVTVKDDIMIDNTGGDIKSLEARGLIRELNRKIGQGKKFYPGVGYRNLVKISRAGLNIHTVPPHDILGKKIHQHLPEGKDRNVIIGIMEQANRILTQSSFRRTRKIKANAVWLWGEGYAVDTDSFYKKYGLKGAVISAVDIIKGIARLLKMDVIDVPGITGDFHTCYRNKALYALRNLKKYDFIFIHIEATDEAGHKGDYKEKIKAIEKIDREIVRTLLKAQEKFSIILLPDHPTPVKYRTHINKEVPFIFYSKGKALCPNHHFKTYSENILKRPPLFIKEGHTFLKKIFNQRS
ncbi:MAG: cofactor-independent phosphoglycerate mutase [bacterium]|nr:cofactor-independent phosphoglycerate mutase [bacterium]